LIIGGAVVFYFKDKATTQQKIDSQLAELSRQIAEIDKACATYDDVREMIDDKLGMVVRSQDNLIELVKGMNANLTSFMQSTASNNAKIDALEQRLNSERR
jgi:septal ring factor EnvC (AmiA/AmiB activator)